MQVAQDSEVYYVLSIKAERTVQSLQRNEHGVR